MSDYFWDGATWEYQATVTNNGTNSGSHVYVVSPGTGNEIVILYGELFNGDSAGRTATIETRTDGAARLLTLHNGTLGAGGIFSLLPSNASTAVSRLSQGLLLSGGMDLRVTLASLAINEDSRLGVVARIFGGTPGVTITSPTDAVEVINEDKVI